MRENHFRCRFQTLRFGSCVIMPFITHDHQGHGTDRNLPDVMAAIARAQSLEGARNVENQLQAQQQLSNFLNYGAGYQPGSAQMFH